MAAARRLSALIVNYESGDFAVACAESLQADWLRAGRELRDLEVVVVDNASPADQRPALERLAARGARVVRSPENGGYSRGIELALAHSRGEARDAVAVLNPDVFFLPGSIEPLLAHLDQAGVGAVGPSFFVDPACAIQLPPNAVPSVSEEWNATMAQIERGAARAYAARRSARAIAWWRAEASHDAELLSGACLFVRRGVVAELGSLLDPRYPLYYEDTDLCLRLRARGLRLVREPASRVVHHWARSTGVGERFDQRALERWRVSRSEFFRAHCGAFGAEFVAALDRLAQRWSRETGALELHPFEHLGARDRELVVDLPREASFVLEIALAPNFSFAAGVLGCGRVARIEPAAHEWLFAGRYFARALDLASGALLGAWTFDKRTEARATPLSAVESLAA